MSSPLANKIAECIDLAVADRTGYCVWRGFLYDEEWKIIVDYNGTNELFQIRVKRRDISS